MMFAYGGSWIAGSMTQEELNIRFPDGVDGSEDSMNRFCFISPEFDEYFHRHDDPLFASSPANEIDGIVLCLIDREMPVEAASNFREYFQKRAEDLYNRKEYDKAEVFVFASTIFTICIIKDDPRYSSITEMLESDDSDQFEVEVPGLGNTLDEQLEQSELKEFLGSLAAYIEKKHPELVSDQTDSDHAFSSFLEKLKSEANNLGIPSICFTTKDVNKLRFFLQRVRMPVHVYLDHSVYYLFMNADHSDQNELSSSMFVAFEAGLQMEPIGRYLAIREHKKELSEEAIQFLMEP